MNTPVYMDTSKIKYLTIHCAATPEGRDVKATEISKWDIAKFGQRSYHFVIELDGTFIRTLRDNQVGAHVGGHNTGNIGICYVGGMDAHMKKAKDTRTVAQKRSLLTLIRTYRSRYPNIIVRGHRDWPGVKKDCPSFDVQKEYAGG
jgi:Negative regulator of beta-lactamase expression